MSAVCTHLACPSYDMVLSRRREGEPCGTCGQSLRAAEVVGPGFAKSAASGRVAVYESAGLPNAEQAGYGSRAA